MNSVQEAPEILDWVLEHIAQGMVKQGLQAEWHLSPLVLGTYTSDNTFASIRSRSRLSVKHPHASERVFEQVPTFRIGWTHQEPHSTLLSTQTHGSPLLPPLFSKKLHCYLSCASISDEIFSGNLVPSFMSNFLSSLLIFSHLSFV